MIDIKIALVFFGGILLYIIGQGFFEGIFEWAFTRKKSKRSLFIVPFLPATLPFIFLSEPLQTKFFMSVIFFSITFIIGWLFYLIGLITIDDKIQLDSTEEVINSHKNNDT